MKHLQLKETPKPKALLHSEVIIGNAMRQLQRLAFYEGELLYKLLYGDYPNYENGEEVRIPTSELIEKVVVGVRTMSAVIITLSETIIAVDEDGNEWDDAEMKFDDVAKIVKNLEETVNNKIGVLE